MAGFVNPKRVTDILSGKKKSGNVSLEDAIRLAQVLAVPYSTFYEPKALEELSEGVTIQPAERQHAALDGESHWIPTSRNDVGKTKEIIRHTHQAKRCYAFSQAFFGHLLPSEEMFSWWEESFCCRSLCRVPQDDLPDYMKRAREYYRHGKKLLGQADFHYEMVTPLALFAQAAKVNPDWLREFRRNLEKDDRIELRILKPEALKYTSIVLRRLTPFSKLYSVSTLDDDNVILRQDRDVYWRTVDPLTVTKFRRFVQEAFKFAESRSDTRTLLDQLARGEVQ
jgi:transcriptional regulator with XRE-family HTH domain